MNKLNYPILRLADSKIRWIGTAILFIPLFLLLACSKITDANYEKIQNGMTISAVNAILGNGMKVKFESGGRLILPDGPGQMFKTQAGEDYWLLNFVDAPRGWISQGSANRQVFVYGVGTGSLSEKTELFMITFSNDGRVEVKEKVHNR